MQEREAELRALAGGAKLSVDVLPVCSQGGDRKSALSAKLASAMVDALGAQGSFVAMNNVVSQSVPHLHCHVVPRTKGDGLRGFFWPRTKYADTADRDAWAARITAALE